MLRAEFNAFVIEDRLDRVETDQTLSVLKVPSLDPIDVAMNIARKLS